MSGASATRVPPLSCPTRRNSSKPPRPAKSWSLLSPGYAAKSWFWGRGLARALNRGLGGSVWLGCVPRALTLTPGPVTCLWPPGLLLAPTLQRGCHGWFDLRLITGCVPISWSGRHCGPAAKSWSCQLTPALSQALSQVVMSWQLPRLALTLRRQAVRCEGMGGAQKQSEATPVRRKVLPKTRGLKSSLSSSTGRSKCRFQNPE